mmetsp:Transcript_101168/g.291310  ORF Transcript_101168/g.291310 Transcript_101168/m.291310 type:complete len:319 (+) Transcript_101168:55-1011(+)
MTVAHMEPIFVALPVGAAMKSPATFSTKSLMQGPPGVNMKTQARYTDRAVREQPRLHGLSAVGKVFLAAAKSDVDNMQLGMDGCKTGAMCDVEPVTVPAPPTMSDSVPMAAPGRHRRRGAIRGRPTRRTIAEGCTPKDRWWTITDSPHRCPLTNFPITMLPYPPFKLREHYSRPNPHRLVDGKVLALRLIVFGRFSAGGRDLHESDITALDEYLHRCNLGPHRLGRALSLSQQAADVRADPGRRKSAAAELDKLTKSAYSELTKILRIQENRLAQMEAATSLLSRSKTVDRIVSSGSSSVSSTATGATSAGDPEDQDP